MRINNATVKFLSLSLNAILALCAIIITATIVRDRIGGDDSRVSVRPDAPVVKDWQTLFEGGHTFGNESVDASFVVFSDYQCPACKVLNDMIAGRLQAITQSASVVYRHLPLPSHPLAESAALASECASEQNRFDMMHILLFKEQASLGVQRWKELARTAGVPDLEKFENCMSSEQALQRVRSDVATARRISVRGTPSLVYRGGVQFTGVPSAAVLDSIFDSNKANQAKRH